MYDVITFGSATKDIFIEAAGFRIEKESSDKREICFPLDSKINISGMMFFSGGGGTNTSVTFSNQGLKTAYCGVVGKDEAGETIILDLKKRRVDTRFIRKTEKAMTNHSLVISASPSKRTLFAYRGASDLLGEKDIDFKKLKAKWFYFSPFPGKNLNLFCKLVDFAHHNQIKVAVNPGLSQLSLPKKKIAEVLKKTDVFIVNQEEASFFTEIPYSEEKEVFKKLDLLCPGIAIMTKGKNGVTVSNNKTIFKAPALETDRVLDPTGAGDAFGAGFVSGLIRFKDDMEKAIQLGMANSAACVREWGAKDGLMHLNQKLPQLKITKHEA